MGCISRKLCYIRTLITIKPCKIRPPSSSPLSQTSFNNNISMGCVRKLCYMRSLNIKPCVIRPNSSSPLVSQTSLSLSHSTRELHVTTVREETVAAERPPPERRMPLSNLDLLLPPLDVSFCLCFKKLHKPTSVPDFGFVAESMKKALGRVLVDYYPLAGEMVYGAGGEPEILCNNRGVDFVLASADAELRELDFHVVDLSVAKLVPKRKQGLITFQATELKCGSMVLGFTFDHRVADGYSINKFIVSLIEAARSRPDPSVSSFQRSLLKPRKPALVDSSTRQMYMPFPPSPPSQEISPQDALTSRVYYIESDVLEQLQTQASSEGCRRTKLESFTAFLWKTVAAHAGRDDPSKATSKIGVVVDGRRRLAEQDTEEKMATYFGNVISVPFGEQGIGDLMEKPLSWAAKEVHEFLKVAKTRDHFLSLIDYVETRRPQPQMSRIYGSGADEGPAVVVSSGRSFSMSRSDFGWGAAVFSSIYSWAPVRVGFVTPMLSPAANGDWVVYFFLTKEQFQFIDQEASHVFKPLDSEYLSL